MVIIITFETDVKINQQRSGMCLNRKSGEEVGSDRASKRESHTHTDGEIQAESLASFA